MSNEWSKPATPPPPLFFGKKERDLVKQVNDELVEKELLIPHEESNVESSQPEKCYKIIKPKLIDFISYPYEWSFSQLKDAALITLEIQKIALKYGLTLKDCSAYNVQFFNGKPISNLPQPLILSVGNLIPIKNHKILIKSMRVIKGHLLIIGNGELFSELNQLITKYKIEHKVTIKKSVPNDQIQNYYKSAEIFALAYNTKVESLPIPVIEAMAAGLPIVIPSPEEGFSEGLEKTAVFTESNEKSFTENIQKLLKNENLRKKYSEQSLIKAKEFDSEKIEKREVEIYSELIKGFKK